jgi:hypothetical protein
VYLPGWAAAQDGASLNLLVVTPSLVATTLTMASPAETHLRIESDDVAIRRVRFERGCARLLLLATWLGGIAAIALMPNTYTVSFGPLIMLLGTAMLLGRHHGAAIAGVRTPGKRGVVVIDEAGVEIEMGGVRPRFARTDIASGWTERFRTGEDDVVLQMRSGTIVRWRAANAEEVLRALEAAGVAPNQRAVTLRLGVAENSGMRMVMIFLALILGILTVFFLLFAAALITEVKGQLPGSAIFACVPPALGYFGLWAVLHPLVTATVRIGTDGVAVERLWRKRFVPRAEIRNVSASGKDIDITVRSGKGVVLPVSSPDEAAIVARRINEALADRGDAAAEVVQTQLDRRGRAIGAWLREVRALARGTGGYRDTTLDRDELAAVVEDGAAPAERRIAAAAALASNEAGKKRVRIAAEACADERLRAAIEEAAEEEIAAARIEEALAARELGEPP